MSPSQTIWSTPVVSRFSAVCSTALDSLLQLVLWELIAVQCGVLWLRWLSEEPGAHRVRAIGLGILLRVKGRWLATGWRCGHGHICGFAGWLG